MEPLSSRTGFRQDALDAMSDGASPDGVAPFSGEDKAPLVTPLRPDPQALFSLAYSMRPEHGS